MLLSPATEVYQEDTDKEAWDLLNTTMDRHREAYLFPVLSDHDHLAAPRVHPKDAQLASPRQTPLSLSDFQVILMSHFENKRIIVVSIMH